MEKHCFNVHLLLDCDLVCIIGEVDVKVVGKVQAGDLIYTSNGEQYRGSAVARNPLEADMQDFTTEDGKKSRQQKMEAILVVVIVAAAAAAMAVATCR